MKGHGSAPLDRPAEGRPPCLAPKPRRRGGSNHGAVVATREVRRDAACAFGGVTTSRFAHADARVGLGGVVEPTRGRHRHARPRGRRLRRGREGLPSSAAGSAHEWKLLFHLALTPASHGPGADANRILELRRRLDDCSHSGSSAGCEAMGRGSGRASGAPRPVGRVAQGQARGPTRVLTSASGRGAGQTARWVGNRPHQRTSRHARTVLPTADLTHSCPRDCPGHLPRAQSSKPRCEQSSSRGATREGNLPGVTQRARLGALPHHISRTLMRRSTECRL